MQTKNNKRNIITAICITVAFLLLITCYHYIDKYINGIPFVVLTILVPVLFIVIVVDIIRGLIKIIRNRRNLTFLYCLPTIIYLVIPFIPLPDPEQFESKIVLRGCYEGTQNQAYVLFRQDHSFEVHATGVFFYSGWYTGSWKKNGDTLSLSYDNNKIPRLLTNKVVIKDGYFKPIGSSPDTSKHYKPMFYVGYCKGEN